MARRKSDTGGPGGVLANGQAAAPAGGGSGPGRRGTMRDCQRRAACCPACVRDVQGAQQSDDSRTERQRSPEQPDPQGNVPNAPDFKKISLSANGKHFRSWEGNSHQRLAIGGDHRSSIQPSSPDGVAGLTPRGGVVRFQQQNPRAEFLHGEERMPFRGWLPQRREKFVNNEGLGKFSPDLRGVCNDVLIPALDRDSLDDIPCDPPLAAVIELSRARIGVARQILHVVQPNPLAEQVGDRGDSK